MRHRDKHKTVFICLLWIENIRGNRVHKSQYAKNVLGYRDLVYYK